MKNQPKTKVKILIGFIFIRMHLDKEYLIHYSVLDFDGNPNDDLQEAIPFPTKEEAVNWASQNPHRYDYALQAIYK